MKSNVSFLSDTIVVQTVIIYTNHRSRAIVSRGER